MSKFEYIKILTKNIPQSPGIYQFIDSSKKIIYIGKAKNLRKRILSYAKIHDYKKTNLMISKIADIKYFIVPTEIDALLLENNLIKKYQPRYNVLLKDDKTYPFICIKNEPFPRVFYTRKVINDGSTYYGPYTSVKMVRTLIDFFQQLYPIRNCNLKLTSENISKRKFKLCLEYHIGNCKAPCEGLHPIEDYEMNINSIKKILNGDIKSVISNFTEIMLSFSNALEFEKAQYIKEKIKLLENYQSKSTIVSTKINNVDVFTIVSNNISAFVNFLKISNGAIIQTHTIEIIKKLNESDKDLLEIAITDLRQRFNSQSTQIFTSIPVSKIYPNVKFSVPMIGDKFKLTELSKRNAFFMMREKIKIKDQKNKTRNENNVLELLKNELNLKNLPIHIECFDNSNTQGTSPAAACVVFRNGKPSTKEYRHFNIKTVSGPDDYKSMEEVVFRRYRRLLSENKDLPQLIIIDGGKGQLSSAVKSLESLKLMQKIEIIGIAKRLEEIFKFNDSIPLYLDKRSSSLKLIQHLRNEAHRFSLRHHRNKRSKNTFKTSLDAIDGIGEKTIMKLINNFGSIKKIKEASKEDIVKIIGSKKYDKLILNLH